MRFEYEGGTSTNTGLSISLDDVLRGNKAPFGGSQASGTGNFLIPGLTYDKGDPSVWNRFADTVVEAFSGVHDFLNDNLGFAYGPTGLAAQDESWWTALMNFTNIGLSAPMSFNNLVTPEMAPWLQDYYDSLRRDK